MTEFDITRVEVTGDPLDRRVQFHLTGPALDEFSRLAILGGERRLVLLVDGRAVGIGRFDRVLEGDSLQFYVEVPEEGLPVFAAQLERTLVGLRELVRKNP